MPDRAETNPPLQPAEALYVHVPFCRRRCGYCDFYSVTGREPGSYIRALAAELQSRQTELAERVRTVFLGGGTPTSLAEGDLAALMDVLAAPGRSAREFTVEANPTALAPPKLDRLVAGGVNRLSLGCQRFIKSQLATLGRSHTPADVRDSLARAERAGIGRRSLDLIYGVPGQSLASWRASLGEALSLSIEHLSCYALSAEEGTPLGEAILRGRLEPPCQAQQEAMYFAAIELAAEAGLEQYEISNFAAPGAQCLHNRVYWRNEPYLGLGPAAASYIAGRRSCNTADLDAYLSALAAGKTPPASGERLTGLQAAAEGAMLGLRLREGVNREEFLGRYGVDFTEAFARTVDRYLRSGWLVVTPKSVVLAADRQFQADTLLADLIAEASLGDVR